MAMRSLNIGSVVQSPRYLYKRCKVVQAHVNKGEVPRSQGERGCTTMQGNAALSGSEGNGEVTRRRNRGNRGLVVAAAVMALVTASSVSMAVASPRKSTCANSPERAVRACIWHAAKKYKVSYPMLLRKARCESTLNPKAKSVIDSELELVHAGLFQFRYSPNKYVSDTWKTTPYANRSPWRAKWNSLAAAWMHSVGRGGEWECR